MAPIIDARVRLPAELRPAITDSCVSELLSQYDLVLGVREKSARSLGELISEMAVVHVDHAIVHAEYEYGDPADGLNEAVAQLVDQDPSRFSGFGTVSLSDLHVMRAVRQVQRAADLGLVGINLSPAFFDLAIDHPALYPVYAKAAELGLPVAVHTGINYSRRHPIEPEHPLRLDRVACDFPELTLIACHAAWPWTAEMVAVARRHPSVLMDFGGMAPKYLGVAGSGWEVMRRFMNTLLRDQILFATDWPVFPLPRAVEEWRALGLPEETLAAALGGNAERLLSAARASGSSQAIRRDEPASP